MIDAIYDYDNSIIKDFINCENMNDIIKNTQRIGFLIAIIQPSIYMYKTIDIPKFQ